MSTAMLRNQECETPAWDASETGRQVGVLAGPEHSGHRQDRILVRIGFGHKLKDNL